VGHRFQGVLAGPRDRGVAKCRRQVRERLDSHVVAQSVDAVDVVVQRRGLHSQILCYPAQRHPLVTVAIAISIFENGDSTDLEYLWVDFIIPLWVGLLASFAAGCLAAPLFGWSWRRHRRIRRERTMVSLS